MEPTTLAFCFVSPVPPPSLPFSLGVPSGQCSENPLSIDGEFPCHSWPVQTTGTAQERLRFVILGMGWVFKHLLRHTPRGHLDCLCEIVVLKAVFDPLLFHDGRYVDALVRFPSILRHGLPGREMRCGQGRMARLVVTSRESPKIRKALRSLVRWGREAYS